MEGVCVSTGSACHSGAQEPSEILLAMGLDGDAARSALRLSLSRLSTAADVDRCLELFPRVLRRVLK